MMAGGGMQTTNERPANLASSKGEKMADNLVAKAETEIRAPAARVWDALVNPEKIKQYMFGTTVTSEWTEGSPIIWEGTWKDKPYKDLGRILTLQPQHLLRYSHFSPLSGKPDLPENYHQVTVELSGLGTNTLVRLSQDNNASEEERRDSEQNWRMMLENLKKFLEA
jgi:uncharacterized protein YndB with AHSA1/START domain